MLAAALISLAAAGTVLAGGPGWVQETDGWHYYLEDGSAGSGWIETDGIYYYLAENGRCLTDTVTPDGYYVNGEGGWYRREQEILGSKTTAPERFAAPDAGWGQQAALETIGNTVWRTFGGARRLKMTDTAIEYVAVEGGSAKSKGSSAGGSETVLLGLYREPAQGQYRIDIRIGLDRDCTDGQKAAAYDYGVFQALMYRISSSPEILTGAIYSAWEEDNLWNINRQGWVSAGDCQVTYKAGSGLGRFYVRARGAE